MSIFHHGLLWLTSWPSTNFIPHHIAQQLNLSLSKVVFYSLAVIFPTTYWWVHPYISPTPHECGLGEVHVSKPPHNFFRVTPIEPWPLLVHFSNGHWHQNQLGSSYHNNHCQFQTPFILPSWYTANAPQAPHIYCVSFKEVVLQNEVYPINFIKCEIFKYFNVSHYNIHAMPPHLFHVTHTFQTVLWSVCLPYALANPNSLVSF